MKVLFLANIPSPYRVDFFNELGKNCDLTVAFEGKTATDRDVKWRAQEYRNFKAIYLRGIRTKSDQFLCVEILSVIKFGFDQIVLGGYSTPTAMLAIEYMRVNHIPFWMEADGGLISNDSRIKYRIKHHFISAASGWFSSGKMTTEYLVHYGANSQKVYLYPFTSVFEKDIIIAPSSIVYKKRLREKLRFEGRVIAITVGQFIPRKGFDILLKAWTECASDCHLYIVGGEPTPEYLEIRERLCLTNVHFIGFVGKTQLAEYYQAADLFIIPTREDIWGLVVNEAMANGLPIISTDKCVAGLELVDEKNGWIVQANSISSLKKAINSALCDTVRLSNMGKESIEKIKQYTIEQMAKRHFEVLSGKG